MLLNYKYECLQYNNILNECGTCLKPFYPTALKGCRGIVFTHGVRMGGRAGKVCLGCISETVSCRKLILVRDIG